MMQKRIEKFTDLVAWQEGHKLVMFIYEETGKFPKSEIFGLSSQMRRCAVSITSCIAEGFSRNSLKDKNYFFYISLGSVTELQNQLLIARDLKYITTEKFKINADQSVFVHKLINGLIKRNKNKEKENL
ncbi:MAG: four helix bundle protein [Candidatus Moraniibacteriota bacterium]